MMWRWFAVVVAVAAPLLAQEPKAPAKGPRIAVEPQAFDFGPSLPQKTLTKEFTIRNFGSQDLVIAGVSTSCGCTAALLDEKAKVLKPGGSAPLKVELRTPSAPGRLTKFVLIRSNDPARATLELKVEATVTPPRS
jgi:hypothetical protein